MKNQTTGSAQVRSHCKRRPVVVVVYRYYFLVPDAAVALQRRHTQFCIKQN